MLRKEYLNQTFNFMPNIQEEYDKVTRSLFYDKAQVLITEKKDYDREGLSKYKKYFLKKSKDNIIHRELLLFMS